VVTSPQFVIVFSFLNHMILVETASLNNLSINIYACLSVCAWACRLLQNRQTLRACVRAWVLLEFSTLEEFPRFSWKFMWELELKCVCEMLFSSMKFRTRRPITSCSYYHHHYYHHLLSQVSFPMVLLLLNCWCTPPLRLQVSDCSTFLIMCDVPSTAVFFL
jgi:hypothetical protein